MEHFNLGEIQPKQDKFVLIIHTGRRGGEEESSSRILEYLTADSEGWTQN